jgi:signal transduction histidine kinase
MKNFWKILLGKSIDAVPDEFRKEFWQEVIYTNMRRLRLLLLISTLGYVFLIYFVNVRNIFQMTVENNQSVLILHLTIMLVNACFFLLTQVAMPANHHGVHRLQYRVLFATFCAVIFFFHFFIITVLKTGGYPVFAFLAFLMWVSSLLIPTRVFATFVIMMVASLVILMEIYPLELQAARITEEGKAAAILLSFVLIASSALFFKTFVEAFRQRKYVELERNVIAELHNETSNLNEELQRRQNILEQQASEIEIINTQLQEQNQELQMLNAEKNELMGIVAHDLKNPIGAVRTFAELIHDGFIPPEDVAETSAKIITTSNRMLDLVTNLLDVNRLESGAAEFTIVSMDIAPVLQGMIEGYRGQATAKDIELHFSSSNEQTRIWADEHAIIQVLDNLISNAVKYSPHGKNVFVGLKNHSSLAIGREVSHSSLGISHWSNDNNARPMTNAPMTK